MTLYAFTTAEGPGYVVVAEHLDDAMRMIAQIGGTTADSLRVEFEKPITDQPIGFKIRGNPRTTSS